MNRNRFFGAQSATCTHTRASQSRGLRRAGLFIATIAGGFLFCSTPVRSLADVPPGTHVYVVNSNGSSTDVTGSVFYVNNQAYLYPSNPIAITVNYVEGHVYDQYGALIGYTTSSGN